MPYYLPSPDSSPFRQGVASTSRSSPDSSLAEELKQSPTPSLLDANHKALENNTPLSFETNIASELLLNAAPIMSSTAEPSSSLHSGTFWLNDGSIVLHVENTQFKVHRTLLANLSEVFEDLFNVPQPESSEDEKIDKCHVVFMSGDKAEDFENLLKAVYFPDHLDELEGRLLSQSLDSSLTEVEGILRLSTKYLMRYFRKRCISLLHIKIPNSFEGYSALVTSGHNYRHHYDTLVRVIKIAHEMNVPDLLPYAFYCFSRQPSANLLREYPTDITWKEKVAVLVGKERLGWATVCSSYSFLLSFQPSPNCRSTCNYHNERLLEWTKLQEDGRAGHPLKQFSSWKYLGLCDWCIAHCKSQHLEGRKQVWKGLPSYFSFQPWEELEKEQNITDSV